jgi:hypothetical protein
VVSFAFFNYFCHELWRIKGAQTCKQSKFHCLILTFFSVFRASIRYHLLNHALAESEKPKETDDEKYWRWCEKFGKSTVDPYWIKSGRKIPKAPK